MNPPLNLDEITARAKAATPGPWGTHRDLAAVYTVQARPRTTLDGMENDGNIATLPLDRTDTENYANASFIAHAREDVEALLAEVHRLRAGDKAVAEVLNAHGGNDAAPAADALASSREPTLWGDVHGALLKIHPQTMDDAEQDTVTLETENFGYQPTYLHVRHTDMPGFAADLCEAAGRRDLAELIRAHTAPAAG